MFNPRKVLKFISLSLAAVMMCTALTACGKKNSDGDDSKSDYEDLPYFVITLSPDDAPITCDNFQNLVKSGFYDGLTFHRIVEDFMAQGGEGDEDSPEVEAIKGEFSANGVENNLSHTRGVVSMARTSEYDSATSQFFICYTDDDTFLDGQYAAFGTVTEGMDVVDSFLDIERTTGTDGAQSAPTEPIIIKHAELIDADEDGNPRVKFYMSIGNEE